MKITAFLILIGILHVSANTFAQNITINKINSPLSVVIDDISKQSGYDIVFDASLINRLKPVTVNIKEATIQTALDVCLKNEPLTYTIDAKLVVIKFKSQSPASTPTQVVAKDFPITGRVYDEQNKPLPGVTVKIQDSQVAVATNEDGTYRIVVPDGKAVLIFSFIGYEPQTVTVGNKTEINVTLKSQNSSLSEVVVVGYGTQLKKDVTTAISSLRADDINNFPSTGLDKAMTGKLAGVQVLQPDGAPGAGISIAIRGKSTITAGSSPLYVVDGVPLSDNDENGPGIAINSLNSLNVEDIESVDVLKDASAAAIYGSRGSNGVVIITTKRGKVGKPVISYNAYWGEQRTTKEIQMMNAYQYASLLNDAHNNNYLDLLKQRGVTGSISDNNATRLQNLGVAAGNTAQTWETIPDIAPYLAGTPGLTNTNWQNAIFRTAPTESQTLSISGGADRIKYYVSGNYLDQDGIVINSGYKRYDTRVNLDGGFGKLKIGTSIDYSYQVYQFQPTEGRASSNEDVVAGALAYSPFFPIYNPNGTFNYNQYNWQYGQGQIINPVALATLKTDVTDENKMLGNIFASYDITPDLTDKISFGADIENFNRNAYRPSTLPTVSPSTPTSNPTGNYRNYYLTNWVAENTLSYNKHFGDNSISAIAAVSEQKENQASSSITGTGYPNDLVQTLQGATAISAFSAASGQWSLISALARVQYSYKDKYLASVAVRTDGSSRFGPSTKYGTFPSGSIGWNVDQEDFFKNQNIASSFKLRGSYGVTGNFQIGNYAYLPLLSATNYVFGAPGSSALSNGLAQSTAGNPNLGWEKTSAFNIGTDIGIFKERLHLTVDAYTNNTSNLLLNVPVPSSSGFTTNIENIGKVNNQGLEFSLSGENNIGKLKISTDANISFNRNKVLSLGGPQSIITQAESVIYFITEVGKPIGNYYTLVTNGVYQNASQLTQKPTVPGAKVGDLKYVDQNGDGVIDPTNDRAITGNYQPKFTYGFSNRFTYGMFDLNLSFQGVYGNQIADIQQRYINAGEGNFNQEVDWVNRFVSPSQPGNGVLPTSNRTETGLNATISSRDIESGSYLRLRDVTLGATVPSKLLKKWGISSFRIFATGTDLVTWTKYTGYNPEVSLETNPLEPGVDYGTYPLTRSIVLGMNLKF